MLFKFEGQEIEVPDDFILKCGEHAEARGITLEEYIAEAFTMYKKQLDEDRRRHDWELYITLFFSYYRLDMVNT